ncbi:Ulp1 protease family [Theobroma cacao]|nr:Ulp1 protease family [Theobroma cacao]
MSAMNEEIQRRQYEDLDSLLIVSKEKWAFNVVINTHCKWSQLHYITKTLQQKGEYNPIKRTCFGMLLDVYPHGKACLSKQEFCLITGLKFGPMPDVFRRPYEVAADGIHARYWNGQDNVKLQALLDTFRGGNFQLPGDATKMVLVLIANNILFGQDYRRWVTPWLLSLVEDIVAWNVFPCGHYVWKLTLDYLLKGFEVPDLSVTKETRLRYNIYGFAWVIQVLKLLGYEGNFDPSKNSCPLWSEGQRPPTNVQMGLQSEAKRLLQDNLELWALETLEPTADEALREYFVDLYVPLSEGNKYVPIGHMEDRSDWGLGARQKRRSLKEKRASGGMKRMRTALDHGSTVPEPPTSPPQMQSGNDPSFMEARTGPQAPIGPAQPQTANESAYAKVTTGPKASIDPAPPQIANEPPSRTVNDGVVITRQLRRIMRKHEKDMLELKASIQSLNVAKQTIKDRILATVEIQSSSPESSAVHHGAAEISNLTEWARLKMASKYMANPFVDLLVTRRDVGDKIVEDYEAFKKKKFERRNVGILRDQGADFFITLEDPNEEMTSEHIDACLSLLCKRMTGPKSKLYTTCACMVDTIFFINTIRMLHTEFPIEDARAKMQIPDELQGYVEGERPMYAKKWEDADFILAPCNVGGHWVVGKIDLMRWTIKVVDSTRTSDAKDNGVRAGQMTPLTTMMPFICHQAGYFNNIRRKRQDLDIHLPKAKVHRQNDSVSCVGAVLESLIDLEMVPDLWMELKMGMGSYVCYARTSCIANISMLDCLYQLMKSFSF